MAMDMFSKDHGSPDISPRELVLTNLKEQEWISGQILGKIAGISRSAVWKHIKNLQKSGYLIKSSPKLGYKLTTMPDSLLPQEIKTVLNTNSFGHSIDYFPTIDSTQKPAKENASKGAPEGYLVIAENQHRGRGRQGRNWQSGQGNIAMSMILRPSIPPSEAPHIPLLAGVATVKAIRDLTDLQPWLKWPNDIMIQDKKLAGILIELSAEMDRINYLILGLGLNVNNDLTSFTPELRAQTTSISLELGKSCSRKSLVRDILEELEDYYHLYLEKGFPPIKDHWKELNKTINSPIVVNWGGTCLEGVAEDINDHGALILRDKQGQTHTVTAGDVSLRFKNP